MIHPASDFLHIALTPPADRTAGGVHLPTGTDHEREAWDGLVLGVGPGVMDGAGRFAPLQASHGDRVVCQQGHYQALDGTSGFVRDRHLVALLPGPDHDVLKPCGAYVALAPDPMRRVQESGGGVLVSAQSFRGAEYRTRRRGEELYTEFVGIGRRWERMEIPSWERVERFRHEVGALCASDREALSFAYSLRGKTEFESYVVPSSAKWPGSGCVLGFGPQVPAAVRAAVGTEPWVWVLSDDCDENALPCVTCGALVRRGSRSCVTPQSKAGLPYRGRMPFERVRCRKCEQEPQRSGRCWYDHDAEIIDAWDGSRTVLMVRWSDLAAVEGT